MNSDRWDDGEAMNCGNCIRCRDRAWEEMDDFESESEMLQAFSRMNRMSLCPDCGNKRCPKATWHENPCTGSNEPGQPGSYY